MSETLTLARPYARAAFELARDARALPEWSKALAFAAAVSTDAGVAGMRNDPRIADDTLVAMHLPAEQAADSSFARLLTNRPSREDRKSTRLNSSHVAISYAVFFLKKKKSV